MKVFSRRVLILSSELTKDGSGAGGAGTTAAGLLAGCPTTVVPFFGDQPFWGEACRRAGVGPKPIPVDSFSRHKLVHALRYMARPEVQLHTHQLQLHMLLFMHGLGAMLIMERKQRCDAFPPTGQKTCCQAGSADQEGGRGCGGCGIIP